MIDGQFGPLLEGQPEELGGGKEDPVHQHPVHLEVGPQLGGVEGKPLGPQLLGVVGPVPGRDFDVGALGPRQFRQILGLTACVGHGPRGEARKPSVDRLDRLRRLFLEDVGGVVRVAEEGSTLGAEGCDLHHRLPVVVIPTAAAPCERGLHDPLAERAVLEGGKGGLTAGVEERDDVLAFEVAGLRGFGRRRDLSFREPGQFLGGIHHHRRCVHLVEGVLAEGRRKRSKFCVDLPHPVLLRLGEQGPGAGEVPPVPLHQTHLFR